MTRVIYDICGESAYNNYKIKVKRRSLSFREPTWIKLDLCDKCQDKFLYLKELKGNIHDD